MSISFPLDLLFILGAALVGGVVADRLRLPAILGYMAAGVAFGPDTPGIDLDPEEISEVAELGVVLLMFSIGVQFSLREMVALGRAVPLAAAGQVALAVPLGLVLVPVLDLDVGAALFVGGTISVASTFAGLKLLADAGQLDSEAGRLTVAYLIVQDLSVVALAIILPQLDSGAANIAQDLALAVLLAALFLVVTFALSSRVIPDLLDRIVLLPVREFFLLTVLCLSLGMALAAEQAGLSLAFGAFLAGLVISSSRYGYQALAETLALRDLFAIVFFVALGMVLDPEIFLEEPLAVLALTAAVVLGKGAIHFVAARYLGFDGRVSLRSALTLAQIGEFSFVLAVVGVDDGIISERTNDVILAAVLTSILCVSVAYPNLNALGNWLTRTPAGAFFAGGNRPVSPPSGEAPVRHTVIAGYGRTGSALVDVLRARGVAFLVIERDLIAFRKLEAARIPSLFGDASSLAVLDHCNLPAARVFAVTFEDPVAAGLAVANAMRLNPELDVIVRSQRGQIEDELVRLGASEIVQPELEGALEFIRHTLRRYGVPAQEVQVILAARRATYRRG
ncbi:MAG: cation:proton antiporter [Dehalococcoidia bacterium]